MITIKDYKKPKSIDEAYELLINNKKSVLIGGGAFLKLGSKSIRLAIDLSDSGLQFVNEYEDRIEIGAMTVFHELETNEILKNYCNGILGKTVSDIVGIQMRNSVTVGATVYSRYGFSDLLTTLLALGADVKLYKEGVVPLNKFLLSGTKNIDILESIILKKIEKKVSFKSIRKTKSDYAILNLAISVNNSKKNLGKKSFKVAVGARPNRAIEAVKTQAYLDENEFSNESLEVASEILSSELEFGTNIRSSSEYRKSMSKVLFKRALLEVLSYEN
ncbi:FAD binding domain-containing protein [Helicovermis profundi]|uniref:FAD binding domain-containing protein n=1 Tax=Helicovermis profundi TaxID=3065157 RepID=A0AAU9EUD5_9FIRM|nr:FAD binding domain-containing protein [Clostridia bacterium S502]